MGHTALNISSHICPQCHRWVITRVWCEIVQHIFHSCKKHHQCKRHFLSVLQIQTKRNITKRNQTERKEPNDDSAGFVRPCHLRIVRGQLDRLQCELGVKIIQVQFRIQGRAERGKDLFLVELQKRDTQTKNWCWTKRERVRRSTTCKKKLSCRLHQYKLDMHTVHGVRKWTWYLLHNCVCADES